MKRIDWDSTAWGQAGHNVTLAANGSWVLDHHDVTEVGVE